MPVAVGQALTNASISWLLNKLGTEDVLDFIVKWKLDDQLLRDLKMRLLTINAVLNHAEEKQVDDENVKDWLDEVNFSVYDAEDILEEIAFDAIESKNGMNQAKQSNWLMQMDTQSWLNSSPEGMYGNKKWAI